MVKTLMLLIGVGLLVGCSSTPEAKPAVEPGAPDNGCYQADWQAETAPVINKRLGPDGLDKYETPSRTKEHGCP
ncbi:hypothetical protein JFV28_07085 [Pseudomonas sp. TH05]|uniref:hypothetical protein n=1 Tax=unclassified Pseudomonas TaxID=196821 RepID=UPI000995E7A5|nr:MULTISPECIES: hypothetical protein [unclassified Pseudomonas]MBK5537669.1 hypothetical protein [Pseudomonas sp. TH07]MBK5555635.1 hypothetical protein [Pseudomonas sp. TH05]OOV91659.1 hypothetical protein MF4836_26225 [Pseudomonas sp. MF4836]